MAIHKEAIYHHSPRLAADLTICNHKAYTDSNNGLLSRKFAAQGCYEETI